jgi:hypothetical protein
MSNARWTRAYAGVLGSGLGSVLCASRGERRGEAALPLMSDFSSQKRVL